MESTVDETEPWYLRVSRQFGAFSVPGYWLTTRRWRIPSKQEISSHQIYEQPYHFFKLNKSEALGGSILIEYKTNATDFSKL